MLFDRCFRPAACCRVGEPDGQSPAFQRERTTCTVLCRCVKSGCFILVLDAREKLRAVMTEHGQVQSLCVESIDDRLDEMDGHN